MSANPKPVSDPLDINSPDFDPKHPAVVAAKRDWDRMDSLTHRPGGRSTIRQVSDNVWECQITQLEKGKRYLVAKERGNTPGSATDAALIVARDPYALETAIKGKPLTLKDVRPDLPVAEELDAWASASPTVPPDGDASPAPRRARSRGNGNELYQFVVETVNAGERQWRIAEMLEAARGAGHDADNLRTRVALRDAAKDGAIARVARGLYGRNSS